SGTRYQILEEPNRDFLWMTEPEWRALAPENPKTGDVVVVPLSVRERIFRFHLIDAAKGVGGPWAREDIRKGGLAGTVTEVSAERIGMRLDGSAVMANQPDLTRAEALMDVRMLGRLEYDRRAKVFTRFDVAALAPYRGVRGACQGQQRGTKVRTTLGFA